MSENFKIKEVVDLTPFSKLIEICVTRGSDLPGYMYIDDCLCQFILHATTDYVNSPHFGKHFLIKEYQIVYAIPYYHKNYLSYALYGVFFQKDLKCNKLK